MNRTTEIITVKSVEQIPTLETVRKIPRQKTLKLIFDPTVQKHRENIGRFYKKEL
jgi:hypothetical protein